MKECSHCGKPMNKWWFENGKDFYYTSDGSFKYTCRRWLCRFRRWRAP